MAKLKNAPVALIIMDGCGLGDKSDKNNAVQVANTPVLDGLLAKYKTSQLQASGEYVGLPDGQMGNSEVGHTNIGAGRIIYQQLTRITRDIKNGDFFKISNIQIGYTLPKNISQMLLIQNARVYLAVQNVCCISGYNKYGDPECGQGSVLYTGLDTGRYPMPRTYAFGINVTF